MKRLFLALCVVFAMVLTVPAQTEECGTSDAQIARYDTDKREVPDHGKTFRIPVIFHILYNNKDENIPDSQIQEMLVALQEDFLGLNTDYSDVPQTFRNDAGIPRIRFVLADKLPGDKPTTGIIRKATKIKKYTGRYKHSMFTESEIIAPAEYLNVYICDYEDNGLTVSGNPKKDGIVVRYRVANGETRTITHETGHWLNLRHIWASGTRKKCGDDGSEGYAQIKKTPHRTDLPSSARRVSKASSNVYELHGLWSRTNIFYEGSGKENASKNFEAKAKYSNNRLKRRW
jgi:hypothetical protein